MTEGIKPCFRNHVIFSALLLVLAVFIILATVVVSVFALDTYHSMCICIINLLSYSWIGFSAVILLSLVTLVTTAIRSVKENCCRRFYFLHTLLWLQAAGFLAGLFFLVYFITRFTDVI